MVVKSLVWPSDVASPGMFLEELIFPNCSLIMVKIFPSNIYNKKYFPA